MTYDDYDTSVWTTGRRPSGTVSELLDSGNGQNCFSLCTRTMMPSTAWRKKLCGTISIERLMLPASPDEFGIMLWCFLSIVHTANYLSNHLEEFTLLDSHVFETNASAKEAGNSSKSLVKQCCSCRLSDFVESL